jgi:hypothetical protein
MNNTWTNKEIDYLKNNYNNYTNEEIGNTLNRTAQSIRKKCKRLKLPYKTYLGNGRFVWTKEEKQFALDNYGKLTTTAIGKILNKSSGCVKNYFSLWGLKGASKGVRKYKYDENAFAEINNLSAYYGGFLCADGCISKDNVNCYKLELQIQLADIQHLENFREFLKSDYPIKISKKWNPKKTILYDYAKIGIYGIKKLKDDLERNFHVIPNKTKRILPPETNNDLFLCCFIMGYIDGDGCIGINKSKNAPYLSCVSSSKEIIFWMHNYLNKMANYDYRRENQVSCNETYWKLSFEGLKAAIIINKLRQFPIPKFDRKWNNPEVLERIQYYKIEYPSYF